MSLNTDPRCTLCGNYYPNHTGLCERCELVRKTAEINNANTYAGIAGWPDSKEIVILLNNILYELKELNKKIKDEKVTNISILKG